MELVVKDAVATIKPKDPNSDEIIVLKDATIVTKTKDLNNKDTIKPFKDHSVIIKNMNSLII